MEATLAQQPAADPAEGKVDVGLVSWGLSKALGEVLASTSPRLTKELLRVLIQEIRVVSPMDIRPTYRVPASEVRILEGLVEHDASLAELDEILGYHLEQACRFRRELGQPADEQLAVRARSHLAAAGRRAYARADFGAAVALFERTSALLPRGALDTAISMDLTNALLENGRSDDALAYAMALADRAHTAGDRGAELCGLIMAGIIRTFRVPEGAAGYLEELANDAIPYFESSHDDLGLYVAYHAQGQVANMRAQPAAGVAAYDRAAAYARRAGLADQFLAWRALFRILGTTPASEFLSWFEAQTEGKPRLLAAEHLRATALAMLGRIDEARSVIFTSLRELEDRGAPVTIGETLGFGALGIELLAGDANAAVAAGEESCRLLEASGQLSYVSAIAGMLSRAFYAADRLDEAAAWADRSAELSTSDDLASEMLWRQAKALILARRMEHGKAQELAHQAVSIGAQTQFLNDQAEAYWNLAQVLILGDRPTEAAQALHEALERYERKENLVMAERTRCELESLG